MLNSTHVRNKILQGWKLKQLLKSGRTKGKDGNKKIISELYINILSREPTPHEIGILKKYRKNSSLKKTHAVEDLVWALFNSKEFMYKH